MFTFRWEVPKAGFKWIENPGCLVPTEGYDPPVRVIEPLMEHTGLFQTFAHTLPTREGIKAFADVYGVLWYGRKDEQWDIEWLPEFYKWVAHILELRFIILLWDLVRTGDTTGLARYFSWRPERGPKGRPLYFPGGLWLDTHPEASAEEQDTGKKYLDPFSDHEMPGYEWDSVHLHEEAPLPMLHVRSWCYERPQEALPKDSLIRAALAYVRTAVERRLAAALCVNMRGSSAEQLLQFNFELSDLLSAMWLQCALAITGNKTHRRCFACQTWFELSPEVTRSDRLFCSNACRTRAYRLRMRSAHRLRAQGAELEVIARQLDTEVKTVQKWLAKRSPAVGTARRGRKPKFLYPAS